MIVKRQVTTINSEHHSNFILKFPHRLNKTCDRNIYREYGLDIMLSPLKHCYSKILLSCVCVRSAAACNP